MSAGLDSYTRELLAELNTGVDGSPADPASDLHQDLQATFEQVNSQQLTKPIVDLFAKLLKAHRELGITPGAFGFSQEVLTALALKHAAIDEHGVTVGGRLSRALPIAEAASQRVADYMVLKDTEAPSGLQLWDAILENAERIKAVLGMTDEEWRSYPGQLRHVIDSVETLAAIIDLSRSAVADVLRVTQTYRIRLTPYYASLIQQGRINDPVLLQSVPTGEMVDNAGVEIPPVAADHSPARLVDQFYPRVLTIKATNMCAMYCTHCLRIAHIGKKDRLYSKEAYGEALDYIRNNTLIRDVLITGGDSLILPNEIIRWLLTELDGIDHVRLKRLGTRIPVTAPMRVDNELLDIIGASNEKKPVRVVTQINTAQEITPWSREAFQELSGRAVAVLNQAVLLKGINDTRVKMWKLCETIQEAYVRPYYVFNCSYRNPQFAHLRVPVEVGRDIIESMYGNISGDAIPRYITTAGGKVPMHRDNVVGRSGEAVILKKPWSGEEVLYPDAASELYSAEDYAFARYKEE